jgi:hypothetical protein
MPLSTDVKLDTNHRPTFPNRCIGCGAASPLSSYQLKTKSVGWMSVLFSRSGGASLSMFPPARSAGRDCAASACSTP